jgi:radical SAM enzyme (TIGR01210 family)
MCGHYTGTSYGEKFPYQYFIIQFQKEFLKYDFRKYPIICVYNAGSFLNENEIPAVARREIFQIIAGNPHIKVVTIESRPEFITKEIIREIEKILKNKRVEIGVGLEMEDDFLREICVNKGFNFKRYEHCAKLLSNSNLYLLTYILVKPLFLTTRESIDQAVRTAEWVSTLGSKIISLEPVSMQKGTLVEYFFNKNLYSLPWGWDIIEIMKKIYNLPLEIRIGGFEFFPIPKLFISNCPLCNKRLYEAISKYNSNKDLKPLLSLQCQCKQQWKNQIAQEEQLVEKDFLKRVDKLLKFG